MNGMNGSYHLSLTIQPKEVKMTNKNTNQTEMEVMKEPAKKAYDNEKRIVIFQNNQRTDLVKHPCLRGSFTLNGKIYNVSLWSSFFEKDGKKEKYLQGQVEERGVYENENNASIDDFFDNDQAENRSKK